LEPGTDRIGEATMAEQSTRSFEDASHALAELLRKESIADDKRRLLERACTTPYALVAMRLNGHRGQSEASEIVEALQNAAIRHIISAEDDFACVFVSYSDVRRLADGAFDKNKLPKYIAVASLPFDSVDMIPQQYDLVKFCLYNSSEKGLVDSKKLALSFLKSQIIDNVQLDGLLHPALVKLARYDEANQSNLLHTLKVYLEHDRNAQRCANMLYLHRNSLQYRVRRIQEIAGINLDDPTERAYLRLSFLLGS